MQRSRLRERARERGARAAMRGSGERPTCQSAPQPVVILPDRDQGVLATYSSPATHATRRASPVLPPVGASLVGRSRPSFPRRREPRSGAAAARSIPLSLVCSGPLHRLRGRAREGAAPPPINAPVRHSRERGNLAAARSIPLSLVCSGPLHRLRGRAREGAAHPPTSAPSVIPAPPSVFLANAGIQASPPPP